MQSFFQKNVGFISLFVGIALIVVSVIMVINADVYGETAAIVIERWDNFGDDTPAYGYRLRYEVDGKTYETTTNTSEWMETGTRYGLYYDKNNPAITMDVDSVNNVFIPVGVGILFIIIGVLFILKRFRPELLPGWIKFEQ